MVLLGEEGGVLCVCMCVCVYMYVCLCVCMCMYVSECMCMHVRVCIMHAYYCMCVRETDIQTGPKKERDRQQTDKLH